MSQVALDARIALHPLVFPLSDRAFRALIQVFCYVAQFDTDWTIPTRVLRVPAARELAQNGLLRLDGGVYRVTDEARELARIGPNAAQIEPELARIGHVSKALGSGSGSTALATTEQVDRAVEVETFGRFWEAFGLKTGRKKAEEAWRKAIKRADPEAIIEAARAYREWLAGHPNPPAQKYAQGWLNADRWEDELPAYSSNGRRRDAAADTLREAQRAAEEDR